MLSGQPPFWKSTTGHLSTCGDTLMTLLSTSSTTRLANTQTRARTHTHTHTHTDTPITLLSNSSSTRNTCMHIYTHTHTNDSAFHVLHHACMRTHTHTQHTHTHTHTHTNTHTHTHTHTHTMTAGRPPCHQGGLCVRSLVTAGNEMLTTAYLLGMGSSDFTAAELQVG